MSDAQKSKLGDIELRRIGLGTNRLTNSSQNVELVREAIASGVEMIDTAHTYTGGESETTIGEALSSASHGYVVATKGGWGEGNAQPDVLRAQIEESLRRLRVDTIDLYYLHRVDPQTPLEDSLGAIAEYQSSGKIRHIGLSEVSVEQIERGRQVVPIAAVQNRFNLAERTYDDVVDHCAGEGILFVPFFPLRAEPGARVKEIAARHEATAAQIALAWLLRRSPAMLPIPGTLSPEHLRKNVAATTIELSDEEFQALV